MDVRIHDLRHTFASEAVMGGESLPVVGRILGHIQAQITARYAIWPTILYGGHWTAWRPPSRKPWTARTGDPVRRCGRSDCLRPCSGLVSPTQQQTFDGDILV